MNWPTIKCKSISDTLPKLKLLAYDDQGITWQKDCIIITWTLMKVSNSTRRLMQRTCIIPRSYRYNPVLMCFQIGHGVPRWRHRILEECRGTYRQPLSRLFSSSECCEAVHNMKPLVTKTHLRSFLCVCILYQRINHSKCAKYIASVAAPLNK